MRQNLPWRALASPTAIHWGKHTDVVIEPEVVPIIFVPGIMGTRLTSRAGMIWDPDDGPGFVAQMALLAPDLPSRVRAMVGPQGYHPHHLWPPLRQVRDIEGRSFDNLVQSVYGGVGQHMVQDLCTDAMRLCLHLPVHAFAYNWTQSPDASGQALAQFIAAIIDQYSAKSLCQKVILVTHSMGGLVARAAMRMHHAEKQVLGAVHTFMPTAGAPSLYMRAKTGFAAPPMHEIKQHGGLRAWAQEVAFAALMGPSAQGAAGVLQQMPGALSLLPSHLYPMGSNNSGWMSVSAPGQTASAYLPAQQDPYDEIYRLRQGPVRLFATPPGCPHRVIPCTDDSCWQKVDGAIDEVEHLHRRLGTWCHPRSHHIVGKGLPTQEGVRWWAKAQGGGLPPDFTAQDMALRGSCGGDGDGTVPLQSALCGIGDPSQVAFVSGVEHSVAMRSPEVTKLVQQRIQHLAHDYIALGLKR